jgi:hypothetical protein
VINTECSTDQEEREMPLLEDITVPTCPVCGKHEIKCDATASAIFDLERKKWMVYHLYIEDSAYTVCECGHEVGGDSSSEEGAIDFDASGELDDDFYLRDSVHSLTDRERATVLAALRLYQLTGASTNNQFIAIATDEGQFAALDDIEISELCEILNFNSRDNEARK